MKLIFAGSGEAVQPFTNLLFNCTRNQKCQRAFYVPVNDFSDISFYADLPGSPSVILIEVLNVCDIANVGTAVATQYVTGTKPDLLSYYGVFSGLVVTPPVGVTYNRFFFRFTFTIGGIDYVYYSEQYEFPYCEDLMFVRGCYPAEELGVNAVDCNGIYYGYPNSDSTGDPLFKYIHSGFLRMASIIEQRNKMTFSAFNNKKTYKSVFNREWLLEFELVPTFYKDVLIGVFNRGIVQVNGSEWKLADSQDISIVDVDSKLWKMDMIFDSECKMTYGCKPADCLPIVPEPCCDPVLLDATSEVIPPCEGVCGRYQATGEAAEGAVFTYVDCNGDLQIVGIALNEEFLFCTCDDNPSYSTENVTVVRISDCID